MTTRRPSPIRLLALALASLLVSTAAANAGPAQFVIVNVNAAGRRLQRSDPGRTGGRQHRHHPRRAAADRVHLRGSLWSARLDSTVPIRIRAQFTSLAAGVLGSAGPIQVFRDFPNAPLTGTWYHVALANKLAGVDLSPVTDDINANFSTNFNFYLGLDNGHGELNDLVTVLLHEFAHGLGFSQTASLDHRRVPGRVPGPLQQQAARHRAGPALEPDDQRAAPRVGDALGQGGVGRRAGNGGPAVRAFARQSGG